jgi:hypothetical protein
MVHMDGLSLVKNAVTPSTPTGRYLSDTWLSIYIPVLHISSEGIHTYSKEVNTPKHHHPTQSRPPLPNQQILLHQHHTIRALSLNFLLNTLPADLSLRLAQVLRNLSACQAPESHRAQARCGRRVFVVEQTGHFAGGPEAGDGHVVCAEDAGVEVGFDAAVAGLCISGGFGVEG